MNIRTVAIGIFVLTAWIGAGCGQRISTLELDQDEIEIFHIEERPSIYAIALDNNGIEIDDAPISWVSSNPRVVEVDSKGSLVPKSTGSAVVTASIGELTQRVVVKVLLCSKIRIEKTGIPITIGQTVELDAQTLDETGKPADCPRSWSTGDDKIASVDRKGVVTGKAPGITSVQVHSGAHHEEMKIIVTATPDPMAETAKKIAEEVEELEAEPSRAVESHDDDRDKHPAPIAEPESASEAEPE